MIRTPWYKKRQLPKVEATSDRDGGKDLKLYSMECNKTFGSLAEVRFPSD